MTTLLVTNHNTLITLTNALYMQVVEALYKMPQDLAHASHLKVQCIQVGRVHRVTSVSQQLRTFFPNTMFLAIHNEMHVVTGNDHEAVSYMGVHPATHRRSPQG